MAALLYGFIKTLIPDFYSERILKNELISIDNLLENLLKCFPLQFQECFWPGFRLQFHTSAKILFA